MKIYITQGHEKGIGLEVLFKSLLLLPQSDLKNLQLIAFEASVVKTLKTLKLPFETFEDHINLVGIKIPTYWLSAKEYSESFTALKLGMQLCETGGVLYTLPTSKDQFPHHAGHTEYFRDFYKNKNLGMFFSSPDLKVLLLSDHVAVKNLSKTMTEELIYKRMDVAISSFKKWAWGVKRILISGFNPHAGENGLIGSEDQRIVSAIKRLKTKHKIEVAGPYPGDTMLLEQKDPQDILVYLFHDQGLGVFKGLQGFIGSNITLGLPYPRFSPDHGTSFSLYGKNVADYRGCSYSLREAILLGKRLGHGQDSSHKGQST